MGWEDATPAPTTDNSGGWEDPTPAQDAGGDSANTPQWDLVKQGTKNFLEGLQGNAPTPEQEQDSNFVSGQILSGTAGENNFMGQVLHGATRPASPGDEDTYEHQYGREELVKKRLRDTLGNLGENLWDTLTHAGTLAMEVAASPLHDSPGTIADKYKTPEKKAPLGERMVEGAVGLVGGLATDPTSVLPIGAIGDTAKAVGILNRARNAATTYIKAAPAIGAVAASQSALNQQNTQGYVDTDQVLKDTGTALAITGPLIAGHAFLKSHAESARAPQTDESGLDKAISEMGEAPTSRPVPNSELPNWEDYEPGDRIIATSSDPYTALVMELQDVLDNRQPTRKGYSVQPVTADNITLKEEPSYEVKHVPQIILGEDRAHAAASGLAEGTKSPDMPLDLVSELQGIEEASKDAEMAVEYGNRVVSPLQQAQIRQSGAFKSVIGDSEGGTLYPGIGDTLKTAGVDPTDAPGAAEALDKHWDKLDPEVKDRLTTDMMLSGEKKVTPEIARRQYLLEQTRPKGQRGSADPRTLAMVGATGAGALLGYEASDESPYGAVGGAALGAASMWLGMAALDTAAQAATGMFKRPDAKIADAAALAQQRKHVLATRKFAVQLKKNLKESLSQKEQDRLLLIANKDPSIVPTARETKVHEAVQDRILKPLGKGSVDRGLQEGMIPEYFPRNWEKTDKTPPDLAAALDKGEFSKLSTKTKNMLHRVLDNGWDGFKYATDVLGLKPKYGYVDTVANYAESVTKAHANYDMYKELIDSGLIRTEPSQFGDKAIPADYTKRMGNTAKPMTTYYTSPETRVLLDHLFNQPPGAGFWRAYDIANSAAKRSVLFGTGFHIGTLIKRHQYLRNMKLNPKEIAQIVSGTHPDIEKFWNAPEGSRASMLHEEGMQLSNPEDAPDEYFYRGLQQFKDFANKFSAPGKVVGWSTEQMDRAGHLIDKYTFANTMNGFKILDGTWMLDRVLQKNLNDVTAGKKGMFGFGKPVRLLSEREAARVVASTMNDVYGGQHWLRMSLEAKTNLGRAMKLNAFSPRGRRNLQRMFLAPDWTVSNTRSILKAVDYHGDADMAKLHAAFAKRALFWYFAIGNTINYATTGHSMFENDDPFLVDLGNGRMMQLDKSVGEVLNWFRKPESEALNKLAVVPASLAEMAFNKQYLTPDMNATPIYKKDDKPIIKLGKVLAHTAGNVAPIPGQQLFTEGLGPAAASFSSFPTYKKKKKKE